jgi:hypothetical protein
LNDSGVDGELFSQTPPLGKRKPARAGRGAGVHPPNTGCSISVCPLFSSHSQSSRRIFHKIPNTYVFLLSMPPVCPRKKTFCPLPPALFSSN